MTTCILSNAVYKSKTQLSLLYVLLNATNFAGHYWSINLDIAEYQSGPFTLVDLGNVKKQSENIMEKGPKIWI